MKTGTFVGEGRPVIFNHARDMKDISDPEGGLCSPCRAQIKNPPGVNRHTAVSCCDGGIRLANAGNNKDDPFTFKEDHSALIDFFEAEVPHKRLCLQPGRHDNTDPRFFAHAVAVVLHGNSLDRTRAVRQGWKLLDPESSAFQFPRPVYKIIEAAAKRVGGRSLRRLYWSTGNSSIFYQSRRTIRREHSR